MKGHSTGWMRELSGLKDDGSICLDVCQRVTLLKHFALGDETTACELECLRTKVCNCSGECMDVCKCALCKCCSYCSSKCNCHNRVQSHVDSYIKNSRMI